MDSMPPRINLPAVTCRAIWPGAALLFGSASATLFVIESELLIQRSDVSHDGDSTFRNGWLDRRPALCGARSVPAPPPIPERGRVPGSQSSGAEIEPAPITPAWKWLKAVSQRRPRDRGRNADLCALLSCRGNIHSLGCRVPPTQDESALLQAQRPQGQTADAPNCPAVAWKACGAQATSADPNSDQGRL